MAGPGPGQLAGWPQQYPSEMPPPHPGGPQGNPPTRSRFRRFPWWVYLLVALCLCGGLASIAGAPKATNTNQGATLPVPLPTPLHVVTRTSGELATRGSIPATIAALPTFPTAVPTIARPLVLATIASTPTQKPVLIVAVTDTPAVSALPTDVAAPPAGQVTITKPPGTAGHNAYASVSAHTSPGAACSITVEYSSGVSNAQGLGDKKADANGNASWSWQIGRSTKAGTWPVTVTCAGASAQTAVTVP